MGPFLYSRKFFTKKSATAYSKSYRSPRILKHAAVSVRWDVNEHLKHAFQGKYQYVLVQTLFLLLLHSRKATLLLCDGQTTTMDADVTLHFCRVLLNVL